MLNMVWLHHISNMKWTHFVISRNLGEKISSIELDTPSITQDQLSEIERIANEKILAGVQMYPTLYENVDDPALKAVS